MRRNCVILGRWFAAVLMTLLMVFVPLRYVAAREMTLERSVAESELELAVSRVIRDGRITVDDIERLERSGRYKTEVTIGNRTEILQSREEAAAADDSLNAVHADMMNVPMYSYDMWGADEFARRLDEHGEISLGYGDVISVSLTRRSYSVAETVWTKLCPTCSVGDRLTDGGMFLGKM